MSESRSASDIPNAAPERRASGSIVFEWWQNLRHPQHGDPGTLARLRRSRGTLEAMTVRAAVALARRLGATGPDAPDARMRDAIDLARVVAHVKEHREDRIMHAAGWKHFAGDRKEADAEKDRPKLSEARFRRLLETGGGEERVISFVRLVRLLDHTINVRNLAEDFLALNHPRKRDRVREQWAFDYYAAGLAAPSATAIDSSNAEDAT